MTHATPKFTLIHVFTSLVHFFSFKSCVSFLYMRHFVKLFHPLSTSKLDISFAFFNFLSFSFYIFSSLFKGNSSLGFYIQFTFLLLAIWSIFTLGYPFLWDDSQIQFLSHPHRSKFILNFLSHLFSPPSFSFNSGVICGRKWFYLPFFHQCNFFPLSKKESQRSQSSEICKTSVRIGSTRIKVTSSIPMSSWV